MKHFTDDEYILALSTATAVCIQRGPDGRKNEPVEQPLWLTAGEAECLLILCVASPASAGPYEQSLFTKLSNHFRSHVL